MSRTQLHPKKIVVSNLKEYFSCIETDQYYYLSILEDKICNTKNPETLETITIENGLLLCFELTGINMSGSLTVWYYKFNSLKNAGE